MGIHNIIIFSRQLSIHGTVRTCTWTRLQSNALASSITVQVPAGDVSGWRVGDQIVIAPSGYDPTENEIRTIANINGGVKRTRVTCMVDRIDLPDLCVYNNQCLWKFHS